MSRYDRMLARAPRQNVATGRQVTMPCLSTRSSSIAACRAQGVTDERVRQQALRREAKTILDGPLPYLLGRLRKGQTGGGNTLYTFEEANEAEVTVARQFLATRPNAL